MIEDLRPYCPSKYLELYDDWVAATKAQFRSLRARRGEAAEPDGAPKLDQSANLTFGDNETGKARFDRKHLNSLTAGHHDVHARLRDMDWDGVAVEVIFHGSQNEEAFPFVGRRDWMVAYADQNFELLQVGYHMYNQWLADFVSVDPYRHVGLAYLPMWDCALAVEEAKHAAEAGLRGINLPAPRGGIPEYDDPVWEPLWSVCEDRGLVLASHVGVPNHPLFGPQSFALTVLEVEGWPSRRGMPRLIFGGVFERHPRLQMVLTEQTRRWWAYTLRELDEAYGTPSRALREQVPRKPSEYMMSNVFVGASFMGPDTAHEAIEDGYVSNVIWGSDYPHGEGTFKYPEHDDEPSMTRQYLRWAFAQCPQGDITAMVGENGIRAYRLDRDALAKIAARIGPTMDEVTTPLEEEPHGWHGDMFSREALVARGTV
jgi:predicted TIM-barrel fold metal-dependent hydrolase